MKKYTLLALCLIATSASTAFAEGAVNCDLNQGGKITPVSLSLLEGTSYTGAQKNLNSPSHEFHINLNAVAAGVTTLSITSGSTGTTASMDTGGVGLKSATVSLADTESTVFLTCSLSK